MTGRFGNLNPRVLLTLFTNMFLGLPEFYRVKTRSQARCGTYSYLYGYTVRTFATRRAKIKGKISTKQKHQKILGQGLLESSYPCTRVTKVAR